MRIRVTTSDIMQEGLSRPGEYHIVLVQGQHSGRCFVYVLHQEEFSVLLEEPGFSYGGIAYEHFFFTFRNLCNPQARPTPQEVLEKLREIFTEEEIATTEGGIFVDSDIPGVE